MIILLSPAKSLDFETPVPGRTCTSPRFLNHSAQVMKVLKKQSPDDLSNLMNLSTDLSELNFNRNQQWKKSHTEKNAIPAAYAFRGDVYQGLDVRTLKTADLKRLQKHVRILSGLYGLLRPMDLIQPYRLEMGTKLKTPAGSNLYDFWGDTVADAIDEDLSAIKGHLIVNLASKEYSRAAKLKSRSARIVTPAFKEWKNGKFKIISFFAKQARGLMTRYLITQKISSAEDITGFDLDGYRFNSELSTADEPVFTRGS